jgi:ABC-type glycerol-3-phosphate transport system permease component
MKRIGLAALILLELLATAALAVAIRYGRFDQGPAFYVYLLGALAGVAVVSGFALPVEISSRLSVHGMLLLGCALFSMPFVWLLSTSFKYDEELLAYPPRWAPVIPRAVERSPYLTDEETPAVERPAGMGDARWEAAWPKIEAALWERARPLLPAAATDTFAQSDVRRAMVTALWNRTSGGIAHDLWSGDEEVLVTALAQRVDREGVDAAWEAVHRGVMLGDVTVTDDAGVTHAIEDHRTPVERWTRIEGDATFKDGARTAVAYDVTTKPRLVLATELPLPVPADQVLSIAIPLRQDRSWHALGVAVEFAGKRYVASDDLYLGQRRWQEFTFRLAHKDDRDERDVGIWPLVPDVEAVRGAFAEPGKLRLLLTIDRASRPAATWRKFTSNYVSAYLASGHRWTYVFNSAYLVVLTVMGQVLSCSMVAYAFARLNWPGRDALFVILLATMMLPGQVTMVPVFVVFKHLGLYNTLAALWAPSFLGSAFFIFMLRQFMKTIPAELEDAAKIDGCGFFGIYWRIILPLMRPALAAVAIFTFMATWNDFMGPLIYINDQRLYPLSLGLFEFRTEHGADYGMLMAASTLMTLPVVALFFVAQRYFIEGVTLTGMKA